MVTQIKARDAEQAVPQGTAEWFYATGVPGRMWSGWNAAPYQGPGQETEKDILTNKADGLQTALNQFKKRMDEIET